MLPPDGCLVCPPETVKADGNQSAVYPQPPSLKKKGIQML